MDNEGVLYNILMIVLGVFIGWLLTSGDYRKSAIHYGCGYKDGYAFYWKEGPNSK